MTNQTECVVKSSLSVQYTSKISRYLHQMSYQDGTLKEYDESINECRYGIHLFVKEKGNYKNKFIGK